MLHCDLRVRWKVASDMRFWAAISEPKTPSFCEMSGDLAPSARKSPVIAIVRFWFASGSMVSDTELSEVSGLHQVPGRELSEFLSAYHLRAEAKSPFF